jgi:hypothetical protein
MFFFDRLEMERSETFEAINNLRQLITFSITCGLAFLSFFILVTIKIEVNLILFSVILSTFNTAIPIIVKLLVSFEKHHHQGSMLRSGNKS